MSINPQWVVDRLWNWILLLQIEAIPAILPKKWAGLTHFDDQEAYQFNPINNICPKTNVF